MDNPRPEKMAVVDEVRDRLDGARAAILTEYRGLTVSELAALRRALKGAGGDYKIYKNTLVRLAIAGGRHETVTPLLEGPTAIAFVSGEVSAVAKALRDYGRVHPNLVMKGGLYAEGFLSAEELGRLADLPPRDVLLAQIDGSLAAPLRQLAGLMQALPRNLAYGLSAVVEQLGGAPVPETAPAEAEGEAASSGPEAEAPTAEAQTEAPPAEAEPELEVPPTEAVADATEPESTESGAGSPPEAAAEVGSTEASGADSGVEPTG